MDTHMATLGYPAQTGGRAPLSRSIIPAILFCVSAGRRPAVSPATSRNGFHVACGRVHAHYRSRYPGQSEGRGNRWLTALRCLLRESWPVPRGGKRGSWGVNNRWAPFHPGRLYFVRAGAPAITLFDFLPMVTHLQAAFSRHAVGPLRGFARRGALWRGCARILRAQSPPIFPS